MRSLAGCPCWLVRATAISKLLLVVALLPAFTSHANGQVAKNPDESENKPQTGKLTAPEQGIPQVRRINEEIRRVWEDNKLRPSAAATNGEWCRRVYLDILGRVPTVQELREFLTGKDSGNKAKLVNKLLHDAAYTEDYARNWTTIWTTILIGRTGGLDRRTLINREGMQKYLRDSFAREKPYNTMAYELITASGSTTPGQKDFNGAANFLVMKLDENGAQATAMTSKIFLGLQVQCTQCHNHPFNEWKQQKFWEFNAFFRQTRALREFAQGGREVTNVKLVNQDFKGEGTGAAANEAIIYYELRNGLLQSAFPVFVDGTEISKSGYLSDCDRRTELGKLVLQSPYLDKTIVNRMWHHFLGYGFTKPIDDLGPHNTPSHPALLDYLGEEVRNNKYNLKDLIKWIVLSEPYSLSSKITSSNKGDDPLLGETPKFSHFYMRQMQAEELYQSLLVATRAEQLAMPADQLEKMKSDWMQQFVTAFGTDEGDESTTFNGTIPQSLMLMNGDLVKKAIDIKEGTFLQKLASSNIKPVEKVQYLFEAALARRPTQAEIGVTNQLLAREMQRQMPVKGKKTEPLVDPTALALQDIFWAVLNSNEFILQH
jgi:hypothetical protein